MGPFPNKAAQSGHNDPGEVRGAQIAAKWYPRVQNEKLEERSVRYFHGLWGQHVGVPQGPNRVSETNSFHQYVINFGLK